MTLGRKSASYTCRVASFIATWSAVHWLNSRRGADKPLAYNLELAFFPPQISWIQFALRYEHSTELEDEPETIYGIGTSLRPLRNMSISVEYLQGKFKKKFSFNDNDNEQTSFDLIALQATVLF